MLKLNTTSDNVGGVTRIVAIPTNAFRSISFNYLTRRRSLTLLSTDGCIDIECNRNEEVSDDCTSSQDGLSYLHQLQGKIFSLDVDRLGILDTLLQGSWLLLVRNGNGINKLYGSVDVPLRFTFNANSGRLRNGGSVTSYTFQSTQPKPAVLIDYHSL